MKISPYGFLVLLRTVIVEWLTFCTFRTLQQHLAPKHFLNLFFFFFCASSFFPLPDRLVNLIPGKAIALFLRLKWIKKNAWSDKTTWRESEGCRSARGSLSPLDAAVGGSARLSPPLFFPDRGSSFTALGLFHFSPFRSILQLKQGSKSLCQLLLLDFFSPKLSFWMLLALQWLAIGWEHFQSAALPSGSPTYSTAVYPWGCFIYKRKNKTLSIDEKLPLNHFHNLSSFAV